MKNIFEEEATTKRTLRNIKKALKERLKDTYDIPEDNLQNVMNAILKIHGMTDANFDVINFTEELINEKLNDVSVDDNSNKNEKTIAGIMHESTKPFDKAVGYDYLYRQMVKDYGKKEAKRLSGLMYDYTLMLADSSAILKPYCYSLDTSKIVMLGRPFGQLHSKPPQRLTSYIAALIETVHQMSSHLAGAVALGTFFLDIAYIILHKEGILPEDIKNDGNTRSYIENGIQSFVHSMNHLSRNGVESPFTNVSIFDRPKLESILAKDNMWWLFETNITTNYDRNTVVDVIMDLQDIFLDFFDKGDPLRSGMPYRFPVVTVNFSKGENETKVNDEVFLENIVHRDVYRYNIFVSTGTKICSCCRLVNDTELMNLGAESNSFGGTQISLGSHRVITINFNRLALLSNTQEEFLNLLKTSIDDCAKILASHKHLLKKTTDAGLQQFISNGWIRMDRLFSTIGTLGVYEASETMKKKTEMVNFEFIEPWLKLLNSEKTERAKEYGLIMNIEGIPGEAGAVRLANVDKILYENEVPYTMYSNQFIPLWADATIYEKMKVDGKYNKLLDGGAIIHAQIADKTTPAQNKKLIEYSIKEDCQHFALNSIYSECANGHVSMGKSDTCPLCGGMIVDRMTRVVGFFTPVSSWNKVRREWEFDRRKFSEID